MLAGPREGMRRSVPETLETWKGSATILSSRSALLSMSGRIRPCAAQYCAGFGERWPWVEINLPCQEALLLGGDVRLSLRPYEP